MNSQKITQEEARRKELMHSLEQALSAFGQYANYLNNGMKGTIMYKGEKVTETITLSRLNEDFNNTITSLKNENLIHYHELEGFMRTYTALKSATRSSELNLYRLKKQ